MTDDAFRQELASLRTAFESGLAGLRSEVQGARTDAQAGHERLRTDLNARLGEAVEAKVRIELLEENHGKMATKLEESAKSAVETRRFVIGQVLVTAGVLVAVLALLLQWKGGHP